MSARQWKKSEKTGSWNEAGTLKEEYTPKLIPSIIHIEENKQHLLLHPDKPAALVLNPMGMEIYQLCNGRHNIKEITEIIVSRYSQPYNRVYPDVLSFLKRIRDTGFFVSLEQRKKPEVFLPELQGIDLNLTNRCNLKCRHCGIINKTNMEELQTSKVINLIDELINIGGNTISITGGEPLLREDCLFILQYAASRLKTTLLTNAIGITPEIARSIVDMGITVQVSLDGSTAEIHDSIRGKGAYLKTMRGIDLLKKSGIGDRLYLRVTLMKINLGDIKNILGLAREIGIHQIRLVPVEKLGRAKSNWDKLALTLADYNLFSGEILESVKMGKKREQFPRVIWGCSGLNLYPPADGMECGIGRTITIDASGDIFPCTLIMHSDFCLGNINDMTLKDISQITDLKNLYHTCIYRKDIISKCRDCPWRHFCQGGCPASVYAHTGSLESTDDLCEFRDKFYRNAFLGS